MIIGMVSGIPIVQFFHLVSVNSEVLIGKLKGLDAVGVVGGVEVSHRPLGRPGTNHIPGDQGLVCLVE
jgi:hypothetical protein